MSPLEVYKDRGNFGLKSDCKMPSVYRPAGALVYNCRRSSVLEPSCFIFKSIPVISIIYDKRYYLVMFGEIKLVPINET